MIVVTDSIQKSSDKFEISMENETHHLLTGRHLIGLTRAIRGMMPVDEQVDRLIAAGCEKEAIWRLGEYDIEDIVRAFRPGNDVLVVPFLGALGKSRFELLVGIAAKGASLYDLNKEQELDISQAAVFHEINQAFNNAQTAPGRTGASASPNKSGRKPKLTGKTRAAAKLAWEGTVGTNTDIANDFGVSTTWLFNNFGNRTDAQNRARKRIASK